MPAHGAPPQRGERRLVCTRDITGLPVVATDRARYHQRNDRLGTRWTRLGWEHSQRADWNAGLRHLTLIGLTPGTPHRTLLHLPDGAPLVAFARERIGWTTMLTARLDLDDLGPAWLTARREPAAGV